MEPLDDNELNQLLRKWDAPAAPPTLERRVFSARRTWWSWLWSGSIRVPVPVAIAAVVLIALWIHYSRPDVRPAVSQPGSLAGFQPVQQLKPVLVAGEQK
jgi:hypothetical protein